VTNKTLVILTTHFGTNFSGGSTATCEIFHRLQDQFSKTVVVGTELGAHSFHNLEFIQYRGFRDAAQKLEKLEHHDAIFYGDFFNAIVLARSDIPFYFTYHDNWPELGELSLKMRLECLYYWKTYRSIFRTAQHVFTVSNLKFAQVSRFTNSVSTVRNGITQQPSRSTNTPPADTKRKNVVMVGNIDERKYRKALHLFDTLPSPLAFKVDIYGHINDKTIAEKLAAFPFVTLKGFTEFIPYQDYRLLLHTSVMENLSIVWCEAIAHGTKILSFNVGAAAEVINQHRGILIPNYDISMMKQHLLTSLDKCSTYPLESAQTLSAFVDEFNWDKAALQYAAKLFPQ